MKTFKSLLSGSTNYTATLAFIKRAHGSQMYGSQPYWVHPVAVSDTGKKFFGSKFTEDAQLVSLMHDVVEDTHYRLEDLRALGYSDAVVEAVGLLTKDKNLSYEQNIQKIISSGNKLAMMVKFSDNYQNYTGDKSSWPAEKSEKSQAKYKKSMEMLAAKLGLDKESLPE
jgi:(p)ppGpp synthase/HD superfamily hydrolase